jgi:hypothetical protein
MHKCDKKVDDSISSGILYLFLCILEQLVTILFAPIDKRGKTLNTKLIIKLITIYLTSIYTVYILIVVPVII